MEATGSGGAPNWPASQKPVSRPESSKGGSVGGGRGRGTQGPGEAPVARSHQLAQVLPVPYWACPTGKRHTAGATNLMMGTFIRSKQDVLSLPRPFHPSRTHTHAHTHTYTPDR